MYLEMVYVGGQDLCNFLLALRILKNEFFTAGNLFQIPARNTFLSSSPSLSLQRI